MQRPLAQGGPVNVQSCPGGRLPATGGAQTEAETVPKFGVFTMATTQVKSEVALLQSESLLQGFSDGSAHS
jgi:hypothetical protein